jgi:hypothetical protein
MICCAIQGVILIRGFVFRHKCLSWTVEWISAAGEKTIRNALETYPISEAYDRAFPLPKQDRPNTDSKKDKELSQENTSTEQTPTATETPDTSVPTTTEPTGPSTNPETSEPPTAPTEEEEKEKEPTPPLTPHRNLYFYLHRPRTTTKKPVLAPLPPATKLASALRERTVLEFPTIYALPDSPETLLACKETSQFILEEEYLRTASPEELGKATEGEEDGSGVGEGSLGTDLQGVDVDEEKVLEVLKQDLFESVS